MSQDVINLDGKDVVVREDTAKAYRGVNWALLSIAGFIVIMLALLVTFFAAAARNGKLETPAQTQNTNTK